MALDLLYSVVLFLVITILSCSKLITKHTTCLLQVSKNIVLQWGEMPTSVAYIGTGQIMGWGNKAIEIRSVETGHLDGVFMHKKAQRLKFLCERNDKVAYNFCILFSTLCKHYITFCFHWINMFESVIICVFNISSIFWK